MKKIAFIDSGIGGINVLREALKIMPNESYIYHADNLHAPYGAKPKDEVKQYIFAVVETLAKRNIDALVIACNTATSIAAKELRAMYDFPIIGMEPAIKPAVEKQQNTNKRILVTATPLALQEEKLQQLIIKLGVQNRVDLLALPELVIFAEQLEFNEEIIEKYLKTKLSNYNMANYGALILGCTHFLFYKDVLRKILPKNVELFDGAVATIKHLKNILQISDNIIANSTNRPVKYNIEFIFSGHPVPNIMNLLKL